MSPPDVNFLLLGHILGRLAASVSWASDYLGVVRLVDHVTRSNWLFTWSLIHMGRGDEWPINLQKETLWPSRGAENLFLRFRRAIFASFYQSSDFLPIGRL